MPSQLLPTSFLPRLPRYLDNFDSPSPSTSLLTLVSTLRDLYDPAVPPCKSKTSAFDSGYSSDASDSETEPDHKHSETERIDKDDIFEITFAKDWLLSLCRRAQDWADLLEDIEEEGLQEIDDKERARRIALVEESAALVARLSETSPSGDMQRNVLLPLSTTTSATNTATPTTTPSISVTLHDALPSSSDPTSVGLQSWGASILFARMLALNPKRFGLDSTKKQRVLELGAGTGLLSIAWCKILERLQQQHEEEEELDADFEEGHHQQREPDEVLATDFHLGVLKNLAINLTSNFPPPPPSTGTPISATTSKPTLQKLDWSAVHTSRLFASQSSLKTSLNMPPPFHKVFDTIMAADVVYGPTHALWLKSCVEQFLRKPTSLPSSSTSTPWPSSSSSSSSSSSISSRSSSSSINDAPSPTTSTSTTNSTYEPTFFLFVPLRPTHIEAIASIATAFPSASDLPPKTEARDWCMAVRNLQVLERVKGVGRADEQSYRLYEIGWC